MSLKESKSLLLNEINWRVSYLAEEVILLECGKNVPIESIHSTSYLIERTLSDKLKDIVPAYQSIAIFCSLSVEDFFKKMEGMEVLEERIKDSAEVIELPICYEMGIDLDRISNHASMKKEEVIAIHLNGLYRSLFIGFTPGFIYADGLDPKLECPRLESPRRRILHGSIGIAGTQTGIYSLNSPGGWNIIGRTPIRVFDSEKLPPMKINVGTMYRFYQISIEEFESWGS